MQSGELQEEIIPKTFIEAFNLITIYIYKKKFHEYCLYDGNRRLNNNNNNNSNNNNDDDDDDDDDDDNNNNNNKSFITVYS